MSESAETKAPWRCTLKDLMDASHQAARFATVNYALPEVTQHQLAGDLAKMERGRKFHERRIDKEGEPNSVAAAIWSAFYWHSTPADAQEIEIAVEIEKARRKIAQEEAKILDLAQHRNRRVTGVGA